MRAVITGCAAVVFLACSKADQPRDAGAAPLARADLVGTWQVTARNEAGDSLISYRLVAAADPAGWSTILPNREPIPMTSVTVAGDSVVTENGPFPSALRPGVQVQTHGVVRLQGGQLVGYTIAHYTVTTADSVVHLNLVGTKQP